MFNFKALFTPLPELKQEPYVPSLLKRVLEEGDAEVLKYKSLWHVEHVVLPHLREWEKEQKDEGMMPREWEVRTLDEEPFFPGWMEGISGR